MSGHFQVGSLVQFNTKHCCGRVIQTDREFVVVLTDTGERVSVPRGSTTISIVPTGDEIALACERIRASWSLEERERRNCHPVDPVSYYPIADIEL